MAETAYILSDLHVDHYVPITSDIKLKKHYDNLYKKIITDLSPDYFIIAGDIANTYRHNVSLLNYFAERSKCVYWCAGNHDYVIPYKFYRPIDGNMGYVKAIQEECRGNVILLDGSEVYDIGSKKICGTMGCADWKYAEDFLNEDTQSMACRWERWYDSYWGCGPNECLKMMGEEKNKIAKFIEKVDICVTHFIPFTSQEHIRKEYRSSPTTGFFYFQADELIAKLAKRKGIWIAGHSHINLDIEFKGIKLKINAYGYPRERDFYKGAWENFLIEV